MKNLVLGLGIAVFTTGCASVMTAEEQTINVTTSGNKSVQVTVDDKTVTAPGMVTVLRDGKDKVVKTDGQTCEETTPIKKSVTPVFFGNILIGGLLGSTTDSVTGKMWDYQDSIEIICNK